MILDIGKEKIYINSRPTTDQKWIHFWMILSDIFYNRNRAIFTIFYLCTICLYEIQKFLYYFLKQLFAKINKPLAHGLKNVLMRLFQLKLKYFSFNFLFTYLWIINIKAHASLGFCSQFNCHHTDLLLFLFPFLLTT